ncbi:MAG: hypothetical protein K8R10_13470 [Rhodocyclales bacterium]|nr:hypothetical protein [Rhodocyclales bacterium]
MADRTVCVATLGLKPGARLAQAVRRADGGLLLAAGTELDIDNLRQMIQRGIECVHVLQQETRSAEQIAHDVAAVEARVARLFRGASSEARDELAAAVTDYRRRAAA